ncbi:hypothetical protein MKK67_02985 [Methylobacterium sp. J-072]|uniref:hypothetical protein n=1 Tax=Methylobacterium sp. J-072 TaxID=2836651 RepID=UPI001FB9B595|nr:hypothetical protein [Methylobacterium sp. J-072]MCJ2091477.1 hypothetical protein [Methylobacterium sp. J-072]
MMNAGGRRAKKLGNSKISTRKASLKTPRLVSGLDALRSISLPNRRHIKAKRTDRPAFLEKGGVERKIERIKSLFNKAEGSYRERIDMQIISCFEVASHLWGIRKNCADVLDGEFMRQIERRPSKGEALRFVLSKVRTDAKEGSLYYRATEPLFLKGVTLPELSKAVTDAGGYRALAAQHVKFPRRSKQPNNEVASDASDASGDDNAKDQAKDDGKTDYGTRDEQQNYPVVKTFKGTEVVHCKFDGNARDMTRLVTGNWFGVCGRVLGVVDGRPIIEFFGHTLLD